MKAPDFSYVRPVDMGEALAALAAAGEGGCLLAGGQSLMPMLNFRAVEPEVLIDINRISELADIDDQADSLRIGALVRHATLERSDLVRRHAPLIHEAVRHIAHAAIRSRGSIGGSLALADPAAELPACMMALDATIIARSNSGERRIAAEDFFLGAYETALGEAEILTAIDVPKAPDRRHAFGEITRRHGDYAIAGLAMTAETGGLTGARIAYFGIADRPVLVGNEAELDDVELLGDPGASAPLKRQLTSVLLKRAIRDLEGAAA